MANNNNIARLLAYQSNQENLNETNLMNNMINAVIQTGTTKKTCLLRMSLMLMTSLLFIPVGILCTRNYYGFWIFIGAPALIIYTLFIYKLNDGKGVQV